MRKYRVDMALVLALVALFGAMWYFTEPLPPGPTSSPEKAIVVILDPVTMSLGTGVVINSTGLIVTAGHVLDGCDKPIIIFEDGSKCFDIIDTYESPDQDVGLIQIKAEAPLPFLRLGESANLRPGDKLRTVGTPFGQVQWHTYGWLARLTHGGRIDLDVSASPGNSGGPVLNEDNEVVGIITEGIAGYGITRGVSGDMIRAVVEKYKVLKSREYVRTIDIGDFTRP